MLLHSFEDPVEILESVRGAGPLIDDIDPPQNSLIPAPQIEAPGEGRVGGNQMIIKRTLLCKGTCEIAMQGRLRNLSGSLQDIAGKHPSETIFGTGSECFLNPLQSLPRVLGKVGVGGQNSVRLMKSRVECSCSLEPVFTGGRGIQAKIAEPQVGVHEGMGGAELPGFLQAMERLFPATEHTFGDSMLL